MYEEQKEEPAIIISRKTEEPVLKKEVVTEVKKSTIKKKAINKEEPLVSIKPIDENEKMVTAEFKKIDNSTVDIKVAEESGIEKKITKKRKFSTKLFGRGALDERYIESREKKDSKTVTKKAEIKE